MKIIWWQDPRIVSGLEKYRDLSARERKLVLITAHVVIAAVVLFFIAAPIWATALNERQQANELESNALRLEAHLQRLRSTPVLDPNDAVRDDIEKVLGQKAVVDERIQSLTDTLVAPENMPSVLESMMTQDTRLNQNPVQSAFPHSALSSSFFFFTQKKETVTDNELAC